jgi:hypothetical protein
MSHLQNNARAIGPGWPDRAIDWIATGQRSLITREQLLDLGVSSSAIGRAVARCRLYVVHRAVYSVVPPALRPPWAVELAAILVLGETAVLSHGTAARLHEISAEPDDQIHVTVLGTRHRTRRPGITPHFTTALHPQEQHRRNGLPVTSVARTVLDLMPHLNPRAREVLVDKALRKTSRSKLRETVARHPGRPGTPALAALLDPSRPSSDTWSPPEEELRRLLVEAGVPQPESNVALTPFYTPDLLWREQRVAVEYDSEEWHLGRAAFHDDRTRHNDLTATEGYQVLHVTRRHSPMQVLVWVIRALDHGSRNP